MNYNHKNKDMNTVKRNEANWLPSVLDDMLKADWFGGTTNVNRLGSNLPAVNILETEDNFRVEVAAPGKKREDFNIELDNEILIISSEVKKEEETTEKQGRFTRKEFNYSNFKRAFSLPETVNNDNITASYENGVLMITLPKKEEAKVQPKRMIEIS